MAHAESPAVPSRPALLDMSMPKASLRDGRGRLPLPSRRRRASNGFRAAIANEGKGVRLGAERWMMNAHGAGGPKDRAPAHQRDGGRHCARVGLSNGRSPPWSGWRYRHSGGRNIPKGWRSGAQSASAAGGDIPLPGSGGVREGALLRVSPPPGHPGRVWKVKGERRGRPRVMLVSLFAGAVGRS